MPTPYVEVSLTDNSAAVKNASDKALLAACIAIGAAAETNAKKEIKIAVYDTPESPNYKRTGRLRNSLTYAVSGRPAAVSSYMDDNKNVYTNEGTAPEEPDGKFAVYVGTNVDYAIDVEAGTTKMKARPYLKPAVDGNADEYKKLLKEALESGL